MWVDNIVNFFKCLMLCFGTTDLNELIRHIPFSYVPTQRDLQKILSGPLGKNSRLQKIAKDRFILSENFNGLLLL